MDDTPSPKQSDHDAPSQVPEPVMPAQEAAGAQDMQEVQEPVYDTGEASSWEEEVPHEPAFEPIAWSTAAFIEHEKSASWYLMFAGGTLFVTALVFFITQEIIATGIIIIVAASAAFFASRPAETRHYEINEDGIKIDKRQFAFDDFKSFSVVEEGDKDSIWLKPLKRFIPFTIIYFEPKDEEPIIMALSAFLPHEARELDKIDQLTRKLRF